MAGSSEEAPSFWDNATSVFQTEEWQKVRALYLMVALEFCGFAILIPVLPFFMIEELGFSPTQVGAVLAANSAAQLVGAALFGRVSDTVGRRPVVLFGWTWACLGFSATAFCYTFAHVLLVRVLQGFSGGTMALSHAYILDVVPSAKQAQFLGLFGGVTGCAFVLGPALGAGLLAVGVARRPIFLVSGGAALLGTLFGAVYLEESLQEAKRRPLCAQREAPRWEGEVVNTGLCAVWSCRFLVACAQGFMYATYAFLIGDMFEWSDVQFGIVLFCAGLSGAVLQAVIFPAIAKFTSVATCLFIGCVAGIGAFVLYPQPVVAVHICAIACFSVAGSFAEPAIPVVVGQHAGERHLGFGNGVAGAARGLGVVVAPLVAARLYESEPTQCYYTGAGIFSLAAVAAGSLLFLPGTEKPPEQEPLVAKAI